MYQFEYRESTISYDYERRLAEFYFTKQSNYETCKRRNPHYALAEELNPGYRLLYPFNQVRTPEYLLRTPQRALDITLKPADTASSDPSKAS
jgi:hypothetical protein